MLMPLNAWADRSEMSWVAGTVTTGESLPVRLIWKLALPVLAPPIPLVLLSLSDTVTVSVVVPVAVVVYFRLARVALTSARLPLTVTLPLLLEPMLAPPLAVKLRFPDTAVTVAVTEAADRESVSDTPEMACWLVSV